MDQYNIRQMLTNPETGDSAYPDPWGDTALQRVASKLIDTLLELGGFAVVLHQAGGVVKPAKQARAELAEPRPYLAWLDMMACADGEGGVVCRSFGMPHYFGAPNVRAGMPSTDSQAIECSMQAVVFTCAQIAGYNESPFGFEVVEVPEFRVAGTRYPATAWEATLDEDGLFIDLVVNRAAS